MVSFYTQHIVLLSTLIVPFLYSPLLHGSPLFLLTQSSATVFYLYIIRYILYITRAPSLYISYRFLFLLWTVWYLLVFYICLVPFLLLITRTHDKPTSLLSATMSSTPTLPLFLASGSEASYICDDSIFSKSSNLTHALYSEHFSLIYDINLLAHPTSVFYLLFKHQNTMIQTYHDNILVSYYDGVDISTTTITFDLTKTLLISYIIQPKRILVQLNNQIITSSPPRSDVFTLARTPMFFGDSAATADHGGSMAIFTAHCHHKLFTLVGLFPYSFLNTLF